MDHCSFWLSAFPHQSLSDDHGKTRSNSQEDPDVGTESQSLNNKPRKRSHSSTGRYTVKE